MERPFLTSIPSSSISLLALRIRSIAFLVFLVSIATLGTAGSKQSGKVFYDGTHQEGNPGNGGGEQYIDLDLIHEPHLEENKLSEEGFSFEKMKMDHIKEGST
jgi:hypothetical protein